MKEFIRKLSDNPNNLEVRIMASISHDFYSGIEKIFKRIALYIDNSFPQGWKWHKELLFQMSKLFVQRKECIISEDLYQKLKENLRFHSLFRHIYGFEFK